MASISAVTFNSGSTIDGTLQVGQLAIGSTPQDYTNDPGGLKWWSSADLDLGYIIAHVNPNANQPNSQGITGVKVGFWRTLFTDSDFISWAEFIAKLYHTPQTFSTATEANIWLFDNGYWTSYSNEPIPTITLTPTSTITLTPTITPTSTEIPITSTPTSTPTVTPSGCSGDIVNNQTWFTSPVSIYQPSMGSYSWARNNSNPTLVTEIGITTIPYSNTGLNFQAFFGSLIQSDVIRIYNTPDPSTGYVNYEITNAGVFYSGGVPSYVFEVSLKENNNWDNNITYVQTQINFFNSEDVQYNCYIEIPTPTPTETPNPTETPQVTSSETPTPTNTQTPSVTPTFTPTPSTSPVPVTGYGYNLVVLPYNPPTSGNTIFPTFETPGSMSGTTNPNTFTTNGVYWNAIDNLGFDRSSYYNGMSGVSVTAYFTQNGHTAIYSGSPTAFTFDGPTGQQSFNYNPNDRPEQLVLIQSASTNFVTGQTVYISYVVNTTVTPTPTPTNTQSSTPTNTVTPTNTPTPSSTPSLVTSGLIIQLDAYENSSYPGTGTTVYDITGGYNHTLIGATYTVLNGIKCFDCTTGNNRVNYNATGPTLPTSGYTYITWAKLEPGNPSSFRTVLYTKGPPKITPITIPDGTNTLGYWATGFVSSGYDLSGETSVWVQYAVVGTNSSQTFYINGSQVGSTINEGAGGTTHWGWGNNDVVPQAWGYVANMYFYNRILSLSEITQQYNFLAPRFVEGL